jgi:hypothetical protein
MGERCNVFGAPQWLLLASLHLVTSYTFAMAPNRLAKLLVLSFAHFKLGHFSPQQCNYHSSFGFLCR